MAYIRTAFFLRHAAGVCTSARRLWWGALCALLLCACGSDNTFRINGKVDNFGTGNLRVVYYSRGAVQSVVAPAVDGQFNMVGNLDKDAVARIYTGRGLLLGQMVVRPGDMIEAQFDAADPLNMNLDGNDDSKRLSAFISKHADLIRNGDSEGLNNAIAAYVRDNRKRKVSGVLMSDYFAVAGHEREAVELIGELDDAVVTVASLDGIRYLISGSVMPLDSLRIGPVTLLGTDNTLIDVDAADKALTFMMITDKSSRLSDSVGAALAVLRPAVRKGTLQIVDVACDADTLIWHNSLASLPEPADSAGGNRAPGEIRGWTLSPYTLQGLEQVTVNYIPWFIVADSTGAVLYRGPSVAQARDMVQTSE